MKQQGESKVRMLFAIALATSIVGAAIWVMDKSRTPITPAPQRTNLTPTVAPITAPVEPTTATDVAPNTGQVLHKCSEDGQTMYTDKPCPNGAKSEAIARQETNGINGIPRDIVQTTMARIREERIRKTAKSESSVATIGDQNPKPCAEVKERRDYLDALARRPQSAQMQDEIRRERERLIATGCY